MPTLSLYSEAFADTTSADYYIARPTEDLWKKLISRFQHYGEDTVSRLFLRLGQSTVVAVGDPLQYVDFENGIVLPMWMLDSIGYAGCGEDIAYDILTADSFPKATRIVIDVEDDIIHSIDIIAAFSKVFSQLGVIRQGQIIQVSLDEMGGYNVSVKIQILEPGPEVFLDGDEVPLEFMEHPSSSAPFAPIAAIAPATATATATATSINTEEEEEEERQATPFPSDPLFFSSMLPEDYYPKPQIFSGAGNVLGGGGGSKK
jgi:hypothetical protein